MRARNLFLWLGCGVVLASLVLTDPDSGLSTGMMLLGLAVCVLAVAFAHVTRKALTDYPEANMQKLFARASESPTGAGLALIALAILIAALLLLFGSKVHAAPLVIVGDSIAVGLSGQSKGVPAAAGVGRSTGAVRARITPQVQGANVAVVSTGSNDKTVNAVALESLRSRLAANQVVWVLPYDSAKNAAVESVATAFGDATIDLRHYPSADGVHPQSYAKLRGDIDRLLRTAAFLVPDNAAVYAPTLKAEQTRLWGDHPAPQLLAALVEQESCTYLGSPTCWSPTARLKTQREEGAGMGQITRAYRADGSTRFDTLAALRSRYPELTGWTWSNVYQRPDLQLRAMVLMSRDNYRAMRRLVPDASNALAFADAAYNGGMGGVQSDRRACGIKTGCDPQRWFGHVEGTCTKSRAPLYGQRSACDINREHVHNVLQVRAVKYKPLMVAT